MEQTQSLKRFSVHKFRSKNDLTFSPAKYSKFKFGCKDVSREFGLELAGKFTESNYFTEICELSKGGKKIFVISSPYVFIPTATFAMKDYFVREFNYVLIKNGVAPIIEAKVYRSSSYKEEYGELTAEQRMNVMKGDSFHIDKHLVENHICVFLDDIVITGGHEKRMIDMLVNTGLDKKTNSYFLYFAELINQEENPNIENYLNYFSLKHLIDLDRIIKNENFLLNTRVVKYILDSPHEEAKTFFHYQKFNFLHTLYHAAIGNSYHLIPDYQPNFNYLEQFINNF